MSREKITHIDLFSGIGGFALAAEAVWGKENIEHVFCDIEPFSRAVLEKHWPTSKIYGDIRTLTHATFFDDRGNPGKISGEDERKTKERQKKRTPEPRSSNCFLLTGGFPCQPFSSAGRRKGEADDRFLWPEMCRVIGEFRPTWVIAENVRGLLTQGGGVVFERVCTDLEALGYEVQPVVVPAVAVGAPHRRDRVWFIAHAKGERARGESREIRGKERGPDDERIAETQHADSDASHPARQSLERNKSGKQAAGHGGLGDRAWRDKRPDWNQNWLEVATRLCRMDDGVSKRMDRNPRLKALGNAIVPKVAEEIMRAICASS